MTMSGGRTARIAVIGAGAIGGVTAAYLAAAGYDVTLVCRSEPSAALIRERGLIIHGLRGASCRPLAAVAAIEQLAGSYDYILIVTKAYDLQQAALRALPYLAKCGLIVSLQNGMCLDLLEQTVGAGHAAACVVSWSCTQIAPGELDFTGEGGFVIGCRGNGKSALPGLRQALDKVAPTRIADDILAEIYAKLIINSGVTCGGALSGESLGRMLRRPVARALFIALVREDLALAEALGLQVPPFGGRLDYYRFAAGEGLIARLRRQLILLAIGRRYRKLTSSSLTALRRGQPTEVDFLNGWIAARARELGVATPVNERLVAMIKEIEQGKRPISPANLDELMGKI
ncbi:MAG: 2-dehydropantoate 2-reductase [Clostridia bacterium]|nr:2-dehydropantoate 2-reductase [Clostridia bacterium]